MTPSLFSLILCCGIIVICVCRIDHIDTEETRWTVSSQYILLLLASAGAAMAPWNDIPASWPQVFFEAAVFYMLVADSYQWRKGTPLAASWYANLR